MHSAYADVEAAALMLGVPVGTVRYWASIYQVPRMADPRGTRRRLYDLSALEQAAQAQAVKRTRRKKA